VEGLAIRGTLPVAYRNSTFNIPVLIVYYEGYPMRPPVVQVTPTPDMMIKANEFVREDGVVVSDIIKRWNVQCNSKILIEDLIAMFAFKMPVFARNSGAAVPPPVQSQQPLPSYQSPPQQSLPSYQSPPQQSLPSYQSPPQQSLPSYQSPPQQPFPSYQNQPQQPFPSHQSPAQPNLTQPLREQFEISASELISELEALEKDRLALMKSADSIKQAQSTFREEQSQANVRLSSVEQAKISTAQWVSANSSTEAATMTLDQLLPYDNPLATGLLLALAREQAYEETANALVEGFGLRRCSTEEFIRSIKSLYRDLFLEIQRKDRAVQVLKAGH